MYGEKNFWSELQKLFIKNASDYDFELVNSIARVKNGTKWTPLFILFDSTKNEILLYEKNGTTESLLMRTNFDSDNLDPLLKTIDKKCRKQTIQLFEPIEMNGKTLFQYGQIWKGNSYTDLVNRVFKTNHKCYQKCTVNLNPFGVDGFAWIVFINGQPHGYNGYLWKNSIIENEEIKEEYVGNDEKTIRTEFLKFTPRYFADRLVFQKDPDNIGDEHKIKCLGFYTLKYYDVDKLIRVWTRQSKSLLLNINR